MEEIRSYFLKSRSFFKLKLKILSEKFSETEIV